MRLALARLTAMAALASRVGFDWMALVKREREA